MEQVFHVYHKQRVKGSAASNRPTLLQFGCQARLCANNLDAKQGICSSSFDMEQGVFSKNLDAQQGFTQ